MTGWRLYEPIKDKAAVDELHAQLDKRLGLEAATPPELSERPVLIGLVYEKDGVITNGAYLEAEAAICLFGETALALEEWDKAAEKLRDICQLYRIRSVRAFIPQQVLSTSGKLSPIERILKHFGFVRETAFIPFSCWLGKNGNHGQP